MSLPNELLPVGLLATGDTQYRIERSLRFNSADSAYLSRTPASAGNRRTWTWSGWVKRGALNTEQGLFFAGVNSSGNGVGYLYFTSDNILLFNGGVNAVSTNYELRTSQVFRDVSAWYHIVAVFNTTSATSTDRLRLYINGVQVTQFQTATYPSQNFDGATSNNVAHYVGSIETASYLSGYLADIHFIDGQALTPSSFAETNITTGQWVPKAYKGTYGTNGFRLAFADNSNNTATTLGKDSSPNGNNWTPFNLQTTTGGPTSVASASGALPIYNTTDTYGNVKGSGTRTDSNSSSIVLAIPMDGTNNGTTFTDESATIKGSGSPKTLTRTGFITSTTQKKFYGSSGYSDTNYNSITVSSSTDFDFGTGDFTIECWIYPETITTYGWIFGTAGSNTAGSVYLVLNPIGTASLETYTGSSRPNVNKSGVATNAWNHIAAVRSGNTWTVYVNGIAGTPATITQSLTSTTPRIGSNSDESGNGRFNGYIQDLRVYKGVAKYTSNFNPPSATQNSTIAAGNDSLVDTPTSYGTDTGAGGSVRGNYATLNPLAGSVGTISNGNLDCSTSTTISHRRSTFGITSGKWYWECTPNSSSDLLIGIVNNNATFSGLNSYPGGNADGWSYYQNNGYKYNNGGSVYGASYTSGDIIGVAFDADAGTLTFYKNGVSQGQAFSGLTSGPYFAAVGNGGEVNRSYSMNFGQRPFVYTAPSGFKALCDTNLPAPVVAKPNSVFDVLLYTGNGSSSRAITGLQFSPDFIWGKERNSTNWHNLVDIVRGASKRLYSNSTIAEEDVPTSFISFDSGGFTIGNDNATNENNAPYVAWCWDAGSSTTTNTQGSITSSVRANASAGFSIVTWTGNGTQGASVGHGLGVKPSLLIFKNRSVVDNWAVLSDVLLGTGYYVYLNKTDAKAYNANNLAPSSTLINLAQYTDQNGNGNSMVCYAWAPVAGYSSFGSYTGNGSADGPFVYTSGFRPRWVLIKNASATENWYLVDTARDLSNPSGLHLYPNLSNAEFSPASSFPIDILSNGFKVRTASAGWNTNGQTYIYAAFAESPFQYSRAR